MFTKYFEILLSMRRSLIIMLRMKFLKIHYFASTLIMITLNNFSILM